MSFFKKVWASKGWGTLNLWYMKIWEGLMLGSHIHSGGGEVWERGSCKEIKKKMAGMKNIFSSKCTKGNETYCLQRVVWRLVIKTDRKVNEEI